MSRKSHSNFNQAGFGHVILLTSLVVIAVVGLVGWRVMSGNDDDKQGDKNSGVSSQPAKAEAEPDISLQNLGLASFDSIDITKDAVREYADKGLKGFYVFGDKLSGNRTNPNFEYSSLKTGTKVVSAIDGVVAFISDQAESKDSEVFIQPKEGSAWTIGYDHVTNLVVKKGASIKAGDVIGEPALQNNGLLRFEIQINKDVNKVTTHHCPSTLLSSSVKDKWLGELKTMQDKWESTTGLDLYNVAAQDPAGCLKKTLTVAEAEGR